jgi:hypothetical protein
LLVDEKWLVRMKNKWTIGITSTLLAAGIVAYFLMQKNAAQKKLDTVADAGYETAYDVLYPLKTGRQRRM